MCFERLNRASWGPDGASIVDVEESESVSSIACLVGVELMRSFKVCKRGAIVEGVGDGEARAVAYDEGAARGRPLDDEGLNAGSAELNFVEPVLVLGRELKLDVDVDVDVDVDKLFLACCCRLNSSKLHAVTDSVMLLHVHSPSHTGQMSSSSSALS